MERAAEERAPLELIGTGQPVRADADRVVVDTLHRAPARSAQRGPAVLSAYHDGRELV